MQQERFASEAGTGQHDRDENEPNVLRRVAGETTASGDAWIVPCVSDVIVAVASSKLPLRVGSPGSASILVSRSMSAVLKVFNPFLSFYLRRLLCSSSRVWLFDKFVCFRCLLACPLGLCPFARFVGLASLSRLSLYVVAAADVSSWKSYCNESAEQRRSIQFTNVWSWNGLLNRKHECSGHEKDIEVETLRVKNMVHTCGPESLLLLGKSTQGRVLPAKNGASKMKKRCRQKTVPAN